MKREREKEREGGSEGGIVTPSITNDALLSESEEP